MQILGEEARARVPADFIVQSPDVANPPTLFLPLADMARRVARSGASRVNDGGREDLEFLTAGACSIPQGALVQRKWLAMRVENGWLFVCSETPTYKWLTNAPMVVLLSKCSAFPEQLVQLFNAMLPQRGPMAQRVSRRAFLQQRLSPTGILRVCCVGAAYPRMEAWFRWFQRTQAGQVPGTFRWRGRGAAPEWDTELNRKTFASGLNPGPHLTNTLLLLRVRNKVLRPEP